ncbi:hypothetical protein LIER_07437 [Lithospermum erythrorhizon]|uniref:Uncharacterized protein n=1 Tax=Lithospermum erythrorhizon TaxID=34254 RepID=A0AAV3PAX3_LITER
MLYHRKPGKASPNRWHKYWFIVKDAFLEEVHSTFSTIHTTLEVEESPEIFERLNKLEDGFPKTLALDILCDPDVPIKAGLSKGVDNFPKLDLVILETCDEEVAQLKASLASMQKERDEALIKRDELAELCQKQRSERDGLLAAAQEAYEVYKSEVERLKRSNRELQVVNKDHEIYISVSQKMLKGYYDKVTGMEAQIKELHPLGEDYVVSLFEDLPEEEPADSEDASGSDSSEDEDGDES